MRFTQRLLLCLWFSGLLWGVAVAGDYSSECGAGGIPPTGWNGKTGVGSRTIKIPCGSTQQFSVEFNVTITAADIAAGGVLFKLVDDDATGDDMLIQSTIPCNLTLGKRYWAKCKFTLECYNDCTLVGKSLDEVSIYDGFGINRVCFKDAVPLVFATITGSGDDECVQLALEDDDGDNEPMCNHLEVCCVKEPVASFWSQFCVVPGATASVELRSPSGSFTDSTDITWGLDGAIAVSSLTVVSPNLIQTNIAIAPDAPEGPMTVYVSNVATGSGVLTFYIGNCASIPTLSEWGVIILATLMVGWLAYYAWRRRRQAMA